MADKQTRKYLKSIGIDPLEIKRSKTLDERILEGKEKHRKFLQEQKNLEIRKNSDKNPLSVDRPNIFLYRNMSQDSDYSNFSDLLKNKNWEDE
jgi:hypothetical protein